MLVSFSVGNGIPNDPLDAPLDIIRTETLQIFLQNLEK